MHRILSKLLIIIFLATNCVAIDNIGMSKQGFVNLENVNPTILTNLLYHNNGNFTKKTLPGCSSGKAILTQEAASALSNVQDELATFGYSLVIYNAYYPVKTYDAIVEWLKKDAPNNDELYYPNLTKDEIIGKYIKNKRAHTRGSTVDATIISLKNKIIEPPFRQTNRYLKYNKLIILDDGTENMGSSYDVFDVSSFSDSNKIAPKATDNRLILKKAMENHGFIQNKDFWWQFTLIREPYMDSEFDYDN